MDKELQKEERKQYLHYFRFWFLAVGIMLLVVLGKIVFQTILAPLLSGGSSNTLAPAERVYDYAQVLSEEEENALRAHIASCERLYKIDIVLVTVNEYMGDSDDAWELAMMNYADDFYDENNYGYDQVRGDGVLLLDNWKEGQKGSWLSTCGYAFLRFGNYEINKVLDAVYERVETSPYQAYLAYINTTCKTLKIQSAERDSDEKIPGVLILILPLAAAFSYAVVLKRPFKQKRAVSSTAYVAGGKPVLNHKTDEFKNKKVSSVRISSDSSSSGSTPRSTPGSSSGGSRGGGGSHRSSSGVSHGGGGRRR